MAAPTVVPTTTSLSQIYTSDALATQQNRWANLLRNFESQYETPASFVSRSPGRVNIIGEHIDYSLYSVLPMAITADALLAVLPTPASPCRVDIANTQPEKFPQVSFEVKAGNVVDIDASVLEWTNYFKAGMRGALQVLAKQKGADFKPVGMKILMDGTVPVGGGLSSSAAFVSASALAVMVANGVTDVDKTVLTELAIVSERAVGVNSGGMDQSASVLSLAGSALHVSFVPTLTGTPIFFPKTEPELTFVIAQSFVTANKHETGPIHYNLRVVECTLAAAYLHATLNKPLGAADLQEDTSPLKQSLRSFHTAYFSARPEKAGLSMPEQLTELLRVTAEALPEDGYTREAIAAQLGMTVGELEARYMSVFPVRADTFKLRQRALHVFGEALRVVQFLELLQSPPTTPGLNEKLGALLNQTQDSCRDVYECSCAQIDQLCAIARAAGSYGSRLTGAGWGGCSVHLVPADKVEAVKAAWERGYYSRRELSAEQKESAVVVSKPGSGSAVYLVAEGKLG